MQSRNIIVKEKNISTNVYYLKLKGFWMHLTLNLVQIWR